MAAQFPGALVTTTQLPNNRVDATTTATNHIADHNNLSDEMIAVQAELGINPSGLHSTVAVAQTALMSRWMPLFDGHVNLSAAAAATYPAHMSVTEDQAIGAASPAGYNVAFMYLDPADYAITGYTLKYRVIMSYSQNATNNAATSVLTAGLYPYVGAGATTTWLATLGTVQAGSTAAAAAGVPLASAEGRVISSTFTAPAATTYALGVAVTVATTAGSTRINVRLEYSYA